MLWVDPPGKHPEDVRNEALGYARELLNQFVLGKELIEGHDLKWLDPHDDEVWELRTYLNKPQLRLFGWFPAPNHFVVVHCKRRDALKTQLQWDNALDRVIRKRSELMREVPLFKGWAYGDYIN